MSVAIGFLLGIFLLSCFVIGFYTGKSDAKENQQENKNESSKNDTESNNIGLALLSINLLLLVSKVIMMGVAEHGIIGSFQSTALMAILGYIFITIGKNLYGKYQLIQWAYLAGIIFQANIILLGAWVVGCIFAAYEVAKMSIEIMRGLGYGKVPQNAD